MNTPYALDPDNARIMGVCAGFARWSGADPTVVRLCAIIAGLAVPPVALLAYLATGLVASPRSA